MSLRRHAAGASNPLISRLSTRRGPATSGGLFDRTSADDRAGPSRASALPVLSQHRRVWAPGRCRANGPMKTND